MIKRIVFFMRLRLGSFAAKLIGKEPYVTWRALFLEHFIKYPIEKLKKIGGAKTAAIEYSEERYDDEYAIIAYNHHRIAWPKAFAYDAVVMSFRSVYENHADNYFQFYTPLKDDVVLDLGACEGLFSLLLDGKVEKVYVFEPLPVLCKALSITLQKQLELGSAEICNYAVGDTDGVIDFFLDATLDGSTTDFTKSFNDEGTVVSVQSVTLDSFIRERGVKKLSMIKMDVEGAEYSVLEGARNTLEILKPALLISAYHYPYDYDRLTDFLDKIGYHFVKGPLVMTHQGGQGRPWYRPALIYATHKGLPG